MSVSAMLNMLGDLRIDNDEGEPINTPAKQGTNETDRKLEAAMMLIEEVSRRRIEGKLYGEVRVIFVWQAGSLKEVRFTQEDIIRDQVKNTSIRTREDVDIK